MLLQGLTHLGKGTLTLCPYHSDRQLMSQVAVAGLLTVLVSFLDVKNSELILFYFPPSLCSSDTFFLLPCCQWKIQYYGASPVLMSPCCSLCAFQ